MSSKPTKTISFDLPPPGDVEERQASSMRPRSASDAITYSLRQDSGEHRARSASVGACETIEEEVPSDSESADHIDFNIDLSR